MKGREERNQIIEENIKLVNYIVSKYYKGYVGTDKYEDIRQTAYLGLIMSAERYNSEISKFSTFAIRYIIGYIQTYLRENTSIVHIPAYKVSLMQKGEEKFPCVAWIGEKIPRTENRTLQDVIPSKTNDYEYKDAEVDAEAFLSGIENEHHVEIIRLLMDGLTLREVAGMFGCTNQNIARIKNMYRDKYLVFSGKKKLAVG